MWLGGEKSSEAVDVLPKGVKDDAVGAQAERRGTVHVTLERPDDLSDDEDEAPAAARRATVHVKLELPEDDDESPRDTAHEHELVEWSQPAAAVAKPPRAAPQVLAMWRSSSDVSNALGEGRPGRADEISRAGSVIR